MQLATRSALRKQLAATLAPLRITPKMKRENWMKSSNVSGPASFEWLSQLRFEFVEAGAPEAGKADEHGTAFALQRNSRLEYEFEYQGNASRLVVTAAARQPAVVVLQTETGAVPAFS